MPTKAISTGEGRPNDWLREECRKLVRRDKIVEFLAQVANGSNVEQAVGGEGEVISIPASVRDRLKATEVLLDRGYGKPDQTVDVMTHESGDRPTTEALLQTLTVLRAELDSIRAGSGVAKRK